MMRAARHTGVAWKVLLREALGGVSGRVPVTMPGPVGRMAQATGLRADHLVSRHTLVPFALAAAPPDVTRRFIEDVASGRRHSQALSRIGSRMLPSDSKRRYCPVCRASEKKLYGEAYWHRVHQIPAVLMCPQHKIWLCETDLSAVQCKSRADAAMPQDCSDSPQIADIPADLALALAAQGAAMLAGSCSLELFHQRHYQAASLALGFRVNERVATTAFSSELRSTLTPAFLERLGCDFNPADTDAWPKRAFLKLSASHLSSGKHLLLQGFLRVASPAKALTTYGYRKGGYKARDYRAIDLKVRSRMATILAADCARTSVKVLLERSRCPARIRYTPERFPLTRALLQDFITSWRAMRCYQARATT
jgi:hypothetical protein